MRVSIKQGCPRWERQRQGQTGKSALTLLWSGLSLHCILITASPTGLRIHSWAPVLDSQAQAWYIEITPECAHLK